MSFYFLKSLALSLLISVSARASTFVGNGGNAGDIELQVTWVQISKTLDEIVEAGVDTQGLLCRCHEDLQTHKLCDSLIELNQSQTFYCSNTLSQKAAQMRQLLQSNQGVQVVWTSELMSVREKDGVRDADAVVQPKQNKIYLNREQFLALKNYERIFLLTHELGHMVEIDKRYLDDATEVGPFKQSDGSRKLLNAMAATVAVKSVTSERVDHYVSQLRLSKNYKSNWFSLSLGVQPDSDGESTKLTPYSVKNFTGLETGYRRQLDLRNGISINVRSFYGKENIFSNTKAEITVGLINVQYNYRFFPFDDPLTTSGQSHFILGAGYEAGSAQMKLSDDRSDITEKANLGSPIISGQYLIPLSFGIWLHASAAVTAHNYEFTNIGYKPQKMQTYVNIGATYGF